MGGADFFEKFLNQKGYFGKFQIDQGFFTDEDQIGRVFEDCLVGVECFEEATADQISFDGFRLGLGTDNDAKTAEGLVVFRISNRKELVPRLVRFAKKTINAVSG